MKLRWLKLLALSGLLILVGLAITFYQTMKAPAFRDGDSLQLPGLQHQVDVVRRADGLWKITAQVEEDAMLVQGYLMARDRMFQLDLLRHMARGELSALIGNRVMGDKMALDIDVLNRALSFLDQADYINAQTGAKERTVLASFVRGINLWIEEDKVAWEHVLLGSTKIQPWSAQDSLAIYAMIMHGLGGNADREIRRLLIACELGLDTLEKVWPTRIEFSTYALPTEDLRSNSFERAPAVVPEIVQDLPELCQTQDSGVAASASSRGSEISLANWLPMEPLAETLKTLQQGWSASNNWAVDGSYSQSGKPVLASDPHLPHMNPPIVWGVEIVLPQHRIAGFTLPGIHRVVFGHNGKVAWGATTNHVDRQDLIIYRPMRNAQGEVGYEFENEWHAYEVREELFEIKGEASVTRSIRVTPDGPLLNDLEPFLKNRKVPLTALRLAQQGKGRDINGARDINYATNTQDFSAGAAQYELGCSSWIAADSEGSIVYRSPCQVPIREAWDGNFPIPGWLAKYRWSGYYPKPSLPGSTDPARGWLATANNQIIPSSRFPSTYNNDASAPNRFQTIAKWLTANNGSVTAGGSAAAQMDLSYQHWPLLAEELVSGFCRPDALEDVNHPLKMRLCAWDGVMAADSIEATLFVLLTHAMLDLSLAEHFEDASKSEVWQYAQGLLQFEAVVRWHWQQPHNAPIWDRASTIERENRDQLLEAAFAHAVDQGRRSWGADIEQWRWGTVRPLSIAHPFAGADGLLAQWLNSELAAIGGGTETVFKHQFPRSDRDNMQVTVGPVVRFSIDMADPWGARYSLAGGESGWPTSDYYGNLVSRWQEGETLPLTPGNALGDKHISITPGREAGELRAE